MAEMMVQGSTMDVTDLLQKVSVYENCPECKKLFEERYNIPMPSLFTPEVDEWEDVEDTISIGPRG